MKLWVETRLVRPPDHTVMGRFGASIMDVAYDRWLDRWVWVQPHGIEEKIAEPEFLFLEQDYIANNMLRTPRGRREQPSRIRGGKRPDQLNLGL